LDINIEKDVSYYHPTIDYTYYQLDGINNFLNNHLDQFKVFISNGQPRSGQSFISDLNGVVEKLADDFKTTAFILTDDSKRIDKPNIFYTSDITGVKEDMNEISYLSIFCDIIVGKSSGPYIYTLVKENLSDQFKIYIYICHDIFHGIYYMNAACQKVWINVYDDEHTYRIIKDQITEKSEIFNYVSLTKMEGNKIFIKPLKRMDDWISIRFFDLDERHKISTTDRYKFDAIMNNGITHWVTPYDIYTIDKKMKIKITYNNKTYMRIL
jgi:hypothetical protein